MAIFENIGKENLQRGGFEIFIHFGATQFFWLVPRSAAALELMTLSLSAYDDSSH